MKVTDEYKVKIIQLIQATEAGRLTWKKQNNVILYSEIPLKSDSLVLMSIQKIKNQLVFTIKDERTGEIILKIDSREYSVMEDVLINLFEIARFSIDKESLDFFDNILDSI